MFDRFKKKALLHTTASAAGPAVVNAVAEWAGLQGLSYSALSNEAGVPDGFALTGKVGSKVWKLERGNSSRDYIHGQELRARAELKLNAEVSVVIINRPLKDALEKRAYEMYTDTLQTTADPNLPEEMQIGRAHV